MQIPGKSLLPDKFATALGDKKGVNKYPYNNVSIYIKMEVIACSIDILRIIL